VVLGERRRARSPRLGGALAVALAAVTVAACGSDDPSADPPSPTASEPGAVDTTDAATTTAPAPTTTIEVPAPAPVEPPAGYELVWQDEFDGDAIDLANWTYDIGGWGWGNGEAQYYTDRPENARLVDGLLVIEGRQERFEDSYYTSARLKTQGLQEFQYGYIEARMKVPRGAGTWPAFWMLGAEFDRESTDEQRMWPFVGEIDVMEHLGREPDLILGTLHGPGYSGALGLTQWHRQEYDIADDFHTYAVDWSPEGITWFYDGEPYFTVTPEVMNGREWVFDDEFFLLLNLALGGSYPGPIGLDVEFPVYLYVDHVRVYQRSA
jgi:beta-glucanase (GH16 family)